MKKYEDMTDNELCEDLRNNHSLGNIAEALARILHNV